MPAIALADLASADARFGDSYVIPDLLDPRLLTSLVPQVAAAFQSGVANVERELVEYSAQLKALAESLA